VAAGLGFLVWFFGFMVIGGEWFQMWQSPLWNGQQAAFRFYLTILAVLILWDGRLPLPGDDTSPITGGKHGTRITGDRSRQAVVPHLRH
jgi:hypothetical protein